MNMIISRITEIYAKAELSDPDNMYFNQVMNGNDAKHFEKAAHKKFLDLLSNGFLELNLCVIVPEGENFLPAVWAMNRK